MASPVASASAAPATPAIVLFMVVPPADCSACDAAPLTNTGPARIVPNGQPVVPMKFAKLIKPFRVDKPDKFRLADHDAKDTCGLDIEKAEAKQMLADG